jgi:hypothetical protein
VAVSLDIVATRIALAMPRAPCPALPPMPLHRTRKMNDNSTFKLFIGIPSMQRLARR